MLPYYRAPRFPCLTNSLVLHVDLDFSIGESRLVGVLLPATLTTSFFRGPIVGLKVSGPKSRCPGVKVYSVITYSTFFTLRPLASVFHFDHPLSLVPMPESLDRPRRVPKLFEKRHQMTRVHRRSGRWGGSEGRLHMVVTERHETVSVSLFDDRSMPVGINRERPGCAVIWALRTIRAPLALTLTKIYNWCRSSKCGVRVFGTWL